MRSPSLISQVLTIGIAIISVCEGQQEYDLRLVGSSLPNTGRVEIFHAGEWGTICSSQFDSRDAAVVCRQLNLGPAVATPTDGRYGRGTGPVWLEDVQCTGEEDTIESCRLSGFGDIQSQECNDHSLDAAVECEAAVNTPPATPAPTPGPTPAPTTTRAPNPGASTTTRRPINPPTSVTRDPTCTVNPTVRLVGGTATRGRVEILRAGIWGTICDDKFDTTEARIVCKMLCYPTTYAKPYVDPSIPQSPASVPIWLDELNCRDSDPTIEVCDAVKWNQSDCTHAEDAGVTCDAGLPPSPTAPSPAVSCTPTTMTAVFDTTSNPALTVNSFWILGLPQGDTSCGIQRQPSTNRITVSFSLTSECRTHLTEKNSTHIIYGNTIIQFSTDTTGNIIKVPDYQIPVYCVLDREISANNNFLPDEVTAAPQVSTTNFNMRMQLFGSSAFATPLDPPVDDEVETVTPTDTPPTDTPPGTTSSPTRVAAPRAFVGRIVRVGSHSRAALQHDSPSVIERPTTTPRLPVFFEGNFTLVGPFHGTTSFRLTLNLFADDTFDNPFTSAPQITLGQFVYVSVTLDTHDQQRLKLIVPNCTATPTANWPNSVTYPLIETKCASDNTLRFFPLNETTIGFGFQSFKFAGSALRVYVHCDAFVCEANEKNAACDRSCTASSGRRRRSLEDLDREVYHLSQGPLIMMEDLGIERPNTDGGVVEVSGVMRYTAQFFSVLLIFIVALLLS